MNRDYARRSLPGRQSGPRLLLSWTVGTVWSMILPLVLLAFLVAFVVFVGQRFGFFGDDIALPGSSVANLAPGEQRDVELFTLLPRDARAYPLPVLAGHEIVNDFVGGQPVAVTYCPLCLTGIVFDRHVDGRVVEFGVSGKLLMNDLVMYDRGMDSLWSQILGEAITGDQRGRTLAVIDSLQTTWGVWLELHPNTLVLDNDIGADRYQSYYASDDSGVHGDFVQDDRLPDKAVVLGVVVNGAPRAYPLALAREAPVINDVLGEQPVLTVFVPDGTTGLIYRRVLGEAPPGSPLGPGEVLSFHTAQPDSFTMTDDQTGSVWNRLTGEAERGPLAGAVLERLPATTSFWFGWRDFFPRTGVYGIDAAE